MAHRQRGHVLRRHRQRRQILESRRNAESPDLGNARTALESLDVVEPLDEAAGCRLDVDDPEVRNLAANRRVEALDDGFASGAGAKIRCGKAFAPRQLIDECIRGRARRRDEDGKPRHHDEAEQRTGVSPGMAYAHHRFPFSGTSQRSSDAVDTGWVRWGWGRWLVPPPPSF